MPIFEYSCRNCGARFELLVRSADVPACPACGSEDLHKELSAFAVGGRPEQPAAAVAGPGGCGRCGDPNGPCAID